MHECIESIEHIGAGFRYFGSMKFFELDGWRGVSVMNFLLMVAFFFPLSRNICFMELLKYGYVISFFSSSLLFDDEHLDDR